MNDRQRERRRRFARMAKKQQERQATLLDGAQLATCQHIVGTGDRNLNNYIRCLNQQLLFNANISFNGVAEHWRAGNKIGEHIIKNGIVNQGLNDILGVQFDSVTQKTSWYMGLINISGFTALDPTDIYDDIDQAGNGWDTFQDYTDANNGSSAVTRPEWPTDAPSGQSITNGTTQAIYDITAGGTVKGIFIAGGPNAQTKGDHTLAGNILWSSALFSGGDVLVANSDQLKVTYTVNAAAS